MSGLLSNILSLGALDVMDSSSVEHLVDESVSHFASYKARFGLPSSLVSGAISQRHSQLNLKFTGFLDTDDSKPQKASITKIGFLSRMRSSKNRI